MAADPVVEQNRAAWNAGRYDAWVEALGSPAEEAARLVADPAFKVRRLAPHMGDIAGRRVLVVQGSHGRVAVAFALLGAADVTVIDFAEENRRYALELAAAAGVSIDYRLADSIEADRLGLQPFDWVTMELGILHYHQDIDRFFAVMAALTRPGGGLVLNEFHPVERTFFLPGARGDYFASGVVVGDVPNPVSAGPSLGQCVMRGWRLGEVVTAAVGAGFRLVRLDELPSWNDARVPGMFTLVAERV